MKNAYEIGHLLLLVALCACIWRLGDRIPQPVTRTDLLAAMIGDLGKPDSQKTVNKVPVLALKFDDTLDTSGTIKVG